MKAWAGRTRVAGRSREVPLVLGLVIVQALLLVVEAWIAQRSGASAGTSPPGLLATALDVLSSLVFALVGAVILVRRPGNTIGWLFLVANLGWIVNNTAAAYAKSSLTVGTLPGTPIAAWLATWPGPLSLGAYYLIVLLFPDGRALNDRWQRFAWFAVAFSIAHAVMMAFGAGPVGSLELDGVIFDNPLGLPGPVGQLFGDLANGIMQLATLLLLGISAVSMVIRMRRSRGVEHEQLKWLTWAVVVTVAFWVSNAPVMIAYESITDAPSWVQAWNAVTASSGVIIPIAAGVAILRYRLYEIDRIVSRTVAWFAVTLALVAVFASGVVGLEDLLAGLTQGQTVAVAASTLLVFMLFQPARRRIQSAVDRRFDRARYDGERLASRFAEQLRGEVELGAVGDALTATVTDALRPSGTGLWLRKAGR